MASHKSSPESPLGELRTEFKVDGDTLRVRYTLRNLSKQPLWVFNRLFDEEPSGRRTLSKNKVYVLFDRERGLIQLSKSVQPIPPGLKVEYPEAPYATVLQAGETVVEELTIPIQVREVRPYLHTEASPSKRIPFKHVSLSIGVLPVDEEISAVRPADTPDGVYSISYSAAVDSQQILSTGAVPISVEGLVTPSR